MNTQCVFWVPLQLLSETFLILRRNERDTIQNVCWCSSKVPVIFVRVEWNYNSFDRFWKKLKCKISWKSVQWEPSCSIQTGRRTARHDEGNRRFSQFCERAKKWKGNVIMTDVNHLTPNDHYSGRTAPLNSKRCILYIYSTNIGTEYFKHCIYSPFFSLQNAVCFIILTYLVPVLFTFYIQVC